MDNKAVHNDRYRLSGTYDRLRRALLDHPDSSRLHKTLAYWVLPSDKRLPIAFLDRELGDLLAKPLEELMTTPGVGKKKILAFFDLLRRAAKANRAEEPFGLPDRPSASPPSLAQKPFDLSTVSDAVWATWCETVSRYGFDNETFGRLVPSLQGLPTVMWRVRLESYTALSLPKIRGLKTHGHKRVGSILEVFHMVHEAASVAVLPESIDIGLAPRFIAPVTRWLLAVAEQPGSPPPLAETQRHLIQPLLQQIEIDLGKPVAGLAAGRLSHREVSGSPTIKKLADELGVTRARIYQLLDDCAQAMSVRWPEGRWLLTAILPRFGNSEQAGVALMRACNDLFFPNECLSTASASAPGRESTAAI